MNLRTILFSQYPALFLLAVLFLIAHLRVRKRSAVKSVLWVLLFGAALAVSLLFCFLGMQAKYWTVKTLFELKFWSWLGIAIVALALVLRLVFKLQSKHAQHLVLAETARQAEAAAAQNGAGAAAAPQDTSAEAAERQG